ncbi:helix-turn-helix transcriptional regulator [Duganella sp. LjRoot269]|jgi:AraC-like DNA-binding protein|uniref:helix-turn-helix transcriptional regulator n=1 Tax=Duganella sp. LjRoot269 TaxID=3342305 RepID=UPI003ECDC0C2
MKLDLGWASMELFASAPYSISDASPSCVIGMAFERQRGVHAIGGGSRCDFDAWPGDLALAAPEVDIFSESAHGGEYLALHVARTPGASPDGPRVVFHGDRHAVRLGSRLRWLMLKSQPDIQLIEEQAALFLDRGVALLAKPEAAPRSYGLDRAIHARVLEYIDDTIDGALGLDELARLAGMPPLRFLRSFSSAIGTTPHAYITERRLQRARALLRSTNAPLAAIALDCGFAHQSHLGSAFKARLGMSPHQYRLAAT